MLSFLVYEGGRRMSEERVQVLAMLVTGKITIDQANQLLEVLGEEPLSEPERWSSQSRKQDEGWREPVREFQGRTAVRPWNSRTGSLQPSSCFLLWLDHLSGSESGSSPRTSSNRLAWSIVIFPVTSIA